MSNNILAKTGKVVWELLVEHGHNPETIFDELGINPVVMDLPGARVGDAIINLVLFKTTELISDPSFGLGAVKYWHPSFLGTLGYAWMTSSSLRTAFTRLERYLHTVSDGIDIELEDTEEGFLLIYTPKASFIDFPARTDMAFSIFIKMCRDNVGEGVDPIRVSFTHSDYSVAQKYTDFFRCPIEFNAKQNSILFAAEAMEKPLLGANPELALLNDQLMIRALAKLNRKNIEHRVKATIIEQLPSGNISQKQVASLLHMSIRNLQRKLNDLGTSFRDLLEQTRMELSKQYVKDSTVSLSEVTFLLGFSESSSFSRAYKRWYGVTPGEVRKQGNAI